MYTYSRLMLNKRQGKKLLRPNHTIDATRNNKKEKMTFPTRAARTKHTTQIKISKYNSSKAIILEIYRKTKKKVLLQIVSQQLSYKLAITI